MSKFPWRCRFALTRFSGWFFLINTVPTMGLMMVYLKYMPDFHAVYGVSTSGIVLAYAFLSLAYIAQAVIYNFFCAALVIIVAWIYPRRWLVLTSAVALASILLLVILIEGIAYSVWHFHPLDPVIEMVSSGTLFRTMGASKLELVFVIITTAVLFLIVYLSAWLVWWRLHRPKRYPYGVYVSTLLIACVAASYAMMYSALSASNWFGMGPRDSHLILKAARLVPYYNELFSLVMPTSRSLRQIKTPDGRVNLLVRQINRPLDYPRHPLVLKVPARPLNVVIIGVDTWRYDTLNATVSPNIYRFAEKAWQFTNHFSGGNCTQPGVFTLFTGLPPTYWKAMLKQQPGAILINTLLREHYKLGIFMSAPLTFPAFNLTLFPKLNNLIVNTSGDTSAARDRTITKEFIHFIKSDAKNKPFFSFLFYDAVHNYCEQGYNHSAPFAPAVQHCDRLSLSKYSDRTPYFNRYKNAVYFDDHEVGLVLQALKAQHLLKHTVVMITADHGEQLNDYHRGVWSHGGAYTNYQLHVPMIVYWPGKKPQRFTYRTSHYDIVPTIMHDVLGCKNLVSDYSLGAPLTSDEHESYMVAGSYTDYAIVQPDRVTRIYTDGDFSIDKLDGAVIPGARVHINILKDAFNDLIHYFADRKQLEKTHS